MLDIFGGIGSVAGGVKDFFGNSLKSPLWTAIIISIIIMLILLLFYPAKRGTGPAKHIKILIYVFISTVVILYIHDATIKSIVSDEYKNKAVEETLGGLRQHINGGTSLAVALGGTDPIIPPAPLAAPVLPTLSAVSGGTKFDNVPLKL
jgi:type II secretory pathway component PulF